MSAELIGIIAIGVTLLIAQLGGLGWIVARMDTRFAAVDAKFDHLESKLAGRMDRLDARMDRLDAHIGEVRHELTEAKIAIARIEGPPRRFIPLP